MTLGSSPMSLFKSAVRLFGLKLLVGYWRGSQFVVLTKVVGIQEKQPSCEPIFIV